MVHYRDAEELARAHQFASYLDVMKARLRVSGRVIVGEDYADGIVEECGPKDLCDANQSLVNGPLIDKYGRNQPMLSVEMEAAQLLLRQVRHFGREVIVSVLGILNSEGRGRDHTPGLPAKRGRVRLFV